MALSSKVHICAKNTVREGHCGDCTRYIYCQASDEDQNMNDKYITDWVSMRKRAGYIIYIFNQRLPSDIKEPVYCTASFRDLKQLCAHVNVIKEEEQELFFEKLAKRITSIILSSGK